MQNDDLIRRSDALAQFPLPGDEKWMIGYVINMGSVRMRLQRVPAVEAEPVKRGSWEESEYVGYLCCSSCKNAYVSCDWPRANKWNFCPNCGAKMYGGESE